MPDAAATTTVSASVDDAAALVSDQTSHVRW